MARYNKKGPRLRRRIIGRESCKALTSPGGHSVKLCVTAGKYATSAWLYSSSGKKLAPVSTGGARTIKKALKNAMASVRHTWRK